MPAVVFWDLQAATDMIESMVWTLLSVLFRYSCA